MTTPSPANLIPGRPRLILASGSPRRLALLQQAGVDPDRLVPTEIDETPLPRESPRKLALRLAREKANTAATRLADDPIDRNALIVSADTVVCVGRRILPKAETIEEAAACIRLLSGRTHRVYTGLCLVTPGAKLRSRLIETRVRFKRLSRDEIEAYLAAGEWRGKAGGYAIQGIAGAFVVSLVGSYTSIVGLPLTETIGMIAAEGYPVTFGWVAAP